MYNYARTRSVATSDDLKSHGITDDATLKAKANTDLWAYLYQLTGKSADNKAMIHLANYLKNLGIEFTKMVSENNPDALTEDMKKEILAGLKKVGFGTNQGAASFISTRRILNKSNAEDAALIKEKESSDEDSERPNFHIKEIDNNEKEKELDNLNNNDDSFEKNIDLDKSNNKKDKDNNLNYNLNSFFNVFHSLILMEIGDKIQIMNISLEAKFEKWFYLILGNFFGNLLINYISILY